MRDQTPVGNLLLLWFHQGSEETPDPVRDAPGGKETSLAGPDQAAAPTPHPDHAAAPLQHQRAHRPGRLKPGGGCFNGTWGWGGNR